MFHPGISQKELKMDLISLWDYDGDWIKETVELAIKLKNKPDVCESDLKGSVLSMLFMKPSTRTRVSFEAGMGRLGGQPIYLDWRTTNFTKGKLADEIHCLDRYSDIIMARVMEHEQILEIANAADVPVINGLCDLYHPCQALADLQTIYEQLGRWDFKLAYVGDGNNVANSLILATSKVGAKMSVAAPAGYEPDVKVVEFGVEHGLKLTTDPKIACDGADIVYTDTWVSMGDEAEKAQRVKAFKGYTVDKKLLGRAHFMHCLPAIRGQEVTDEVLDSAASIVFDQAENRMWAQMAVMLRLMGKG